jgi:hypothetical protein
MFTARKIVFVLLFLAAGLVLFADGENYYCVVCGKGPIRPAAMSKWGPVCSDCMKIKERCSLCGIPVKDGDGHVVTGDGRIICKFDKTNSILTLEQAQELFEKTSDEVVDLYGPEFALKNTDVTVKLFDVDYWSENGRRDGLHAFGFASSRPLGDGKFTHEVVMLSGEPRDVMTGVAAHEYTHLWINENRPTSHVIDRDTIEAICELTAYKLMQKKNLPEMQKRILENPYTNGKIKTLVAVEREAGTDYILNWVKNGKTETFDEDANLETIPPAPAPQISYAPRVLPQGLKFYGIMAFGANRQAVINGVAFAVGDKKTIKLRDKSVSVQLDEIHDYDVTVELNNSPMPVKLEKSVEQPAP